MSSPKITTWIACLAFLYAGIPGLAQEVRHSGTIVGYGNTITYPDNTVEQVEDLFTMLMN